jgi:uncharacterized protein YjiK
MKLRPTRVEDVPVPELSGLALDTSRAGPPRLLAIGDEKSSVVAAALAAEPLVWATFDLSHHGIDARRSQFEAIATAGDGTILVLCEDPPVVWRLDPRAGRAERIVLVPGERGTLSRVFEDGASSGEGLLALRDGRLLVAKEKDPPLLLELGPRAAEAYGVDTDSFGWTVAGSNAVAGELQALAAWELDGIDDISDLAFADGVLYCLSDQSRRVVALDLPLEPGSSKTRITDSWELRVPKRRGEPDGKPEGLVVSGDGELVVGLDTETPSANLCWYLPGG